MAITAIFGEGPTATVTGTHKDTCIKNSAPDTSFGSDTVLTLEGPGTPMLMRFDVSFIPTNAVIVSSVLSIKTGFKKSADTTVSVRPGVTACGVSTTEEGDSAGTASDGQATYNNAFAQLVAVRWGGGGAFGASDYGAEEATYDHVSNESVGTEHTVNIPVMTQDWVTNPSANAGLVGIPTGIYWPATQEHTTAAYRPSLTVVYTIPAADTTDTFKHRKHKHQAFSNQPYRR